MADICSICLVALWENARGDYSDNAPSITETKCGHRFHSICINEFQLFVDGQDIVRKKLVERCPLCREILRLGEEKVGFYHDFEEDVSDEEEDTWEATSLKETECSDTEADDDKEDENKAFPPQDTQRDEATTKRQWYRWEENGVCWAWSQVGSDAYTAQWEFKLDDVEIEQ